MLALILSGGIGNLMFKLELSKFVFFCSISLVLLGRRTGDDDRKPQMEVLGDVLVHPQDGLKFPLLDTLETRYSM